MSLLRDIFNELAGMFAGDIRLSIAILALVAMVAFMVAVNGLNPLIGGGGLLVGCLAILAVITTAEARRRNRR
jgi:Flp pilus assembly protein TadB